LLSVSKHTGSWSEDTSTRIDCLKSLYMSVLAIRRTEESSEITATYEAIGCAIMFGESFSRDSLSLKSLGCSVGHSA